VNLSEDSAVVTVSYVLCTALQWILSPEPSQLPPAARVITELLQSEAYQQARNKRSWLEENVRMSEEQRQSVTVSTCGQRCNPHWSVVRRHRLTASNFGSVLSALKRNRCLSLKSVHVTNFSHFFKTMCVQMSFFFLVLIFT